MTACHRCGNPTVFCSCWSPEDWMLVFVFFVLAVKLIFGPR